MPQPDESAVESDTELVTLAEARIVDDGDAHPVATVTMSRDARVVLTGEIDLAVSAELDRAAQGAADSARAVEVDLGQVTFMDSIGVGFIAKLIVAGRANGWRPRLVGPRQQVVETLAVSGVLDAVDLVERPG